MDIFELKRLQECSFVIRYGYVRSLLILQLLPKAFQSSTVMVFFLSFWERTNFNATFAIFDILPKGQCSNSLDLSELRNW